MKRDLSIKDYRQLFLVKQKHYLSVLVFLITAFSQLNGFAQRQNEARGRVAGEDNVPLQGVSVTVVGTRVGTLTDANGLYSLTLPANARTLEFSLVGFNNITTPINGRSEINVTLEANAKALENVTVTGYTTYTRSKSASAASVVTAEKINQVPMTVDQILQGRVPGLVVSANSGQPGASARVILRGVNTISGNRDVLYVMDGIPIESGVFQNINPSDIESMTVLKDASAKALYGSRGSNGVIVITSKRGRSGRVAFDYNSQYGFSKMSSPRFQMMTGAQHLLFSEEIGAEILAATGSNPSNVGPGWNFSKRNPIYATKTPAEQQRFDFILDSLKGINNDWRKFFFQTGKFMEQQVSASGGNENMRFYSSLNYYNQDGIAVRSKLERMTLRNNLDFSSGRLTANVNLTVGYSNSSFIESEGSTSGNNPLSAVFYGVGYEYPYFGDSLVHQGNRTRFGPLDTREGSNALERQMNTSNKTNQLKGILSTSLGLTLAKGLVAKTRLGIDFRQSQDEAFINPDSYSGSRVTRGGKGSFSEASRRFFSFISTSGLTYNKTFATDHDVELSALYEYSSSRLKSFGYTGFGIEGRLPFTPAGIPAGSATTIPTLSGSRTSRALASYIGIGRYTFKNKYTLNASYRYDGSSFLNKNQWQGFSSFGVSWDVKKENFLADVNAVSALRLRASYGTTASPFPTSNDFPFIATFASTTYGGVPGIRPLNPGNPDVDWEYTKESNIGFDLNLFRNRIRIVSDVYNKITSNLYFNRPVSITSGVSSTFINGGSVQNKGVELDLQVDVIKNKNLTWTVGGNVGYNHNEVLDLAGAAAFTQGFGIVEVGKALGTNFAPRWAGVDPATGVGTYFTKDGQITNVYNEAALSQTGFGSHIPSLTGAYNTSLQWKGFSASALIVFVDNVIRYTNEDFWLENPNYVTSNQSIRMLNDRWKKPGDIALLPGIRAPRAFTSRDYHDASYTRIRNVNIGYQLPLTVVSKVKGIRGVRVFVQGENLYTWTKWRGFDSENGNDITRFNYPTPRTYTAGLNVNF
jgi:TonB-linked SusC/RagA family outer membrane protein